jgi:4-amino-4-deoxy-L-arabinose transferase-like glycosyltransferase
MEFEPAARVNSLNDPGQQPLPSDDSMRSLTPRARRLWWAAVVSLLVILAVELFVPARQQSQTPDEANHLLGGVRSWKYGDFGTNPEHPPLAKLVAALPVLSVPSPPAIPYAKFFKMENFSSGAEFLYTHDADDMLWRARVAISIFTFTLALLVLAAGSEMFGPRAGLVALLIFVFEPNLLAHGAMVTTDMASSCCFFAAVFAYCRWRNNPTAWRILLCGIAAGLALAAKHSGLFLIPVFFLLTLIDLFTSKHSSTRAETQAGRKPWHLNALYTAISLAVAGVLAYAILWAFYGFRYQARPGDLVMVPTLAEYVNSTHSAVVEMVIPRLAAWHLLPEAYLFGLVDIATAAKRDPMFLLGVDYATGRWFYFPVAFLIKSTLGFLALLLAAPFLENLWKCGKWRATAYLLVPALMYFGVSLASTMNIGIRHILPVYPFFIVIAAAAAVALAQVRSWGKYAAGGLIFFHLASSAHVFPCYLTYANEAWGGPTNTYRLLTDSNADWGQGLRAVKSYLDANGIKDCWFAHYGWDVDPAYYHIPCRPLPEALSHMFGGPLPFVPARIEGTIVVSGSEADGDYWGPGDLNPYEQFLHRRPDALIANSILVFHGQFAVPLLSALSHMSHARQLADRRQWDQALAEARTSIDLAPNSAEAHAVLGNILLEMGNTEEAGRSFKNALALAHSDDPQFQMMRILKIPPKYSKP